MLLFYCCWCNIYDPNFSIATTRVTRAQSAALVTTSSSSFRRWCCSSSASSSSHSSSSASAAAHTSEPKRDEKLSSKRRKATTVDMQTTNVSSICRWERRRLPRRRSSWRRFRVWTETVWPERMDNRAITTMNLTRRCESYWCFCCVVELEMGVL